MAKLDQPISADGFQLPDSIPVTESMSAREKALRDLFVSEYLVDYDPVRACQRCGFIQQFAIDYAQKFMAEPYVQQQINAVRFGEVSEAELEKFDKKRIRTGLMAEAHYRGPGSSHAGRVSALAKLASLYGMDAPKKIEQTVHNRGGVMAVPGIAALDAWEDAASVSQDNLVRHANDN